ncbi:T9SS type A sorting domain-containing protein [Chryseobacterium tructae]|uniref:T9SS type A sorting domain-containing protein n=1 Tax=Chryseobacterium tructae TaxID=1037380 RepID=A0ABV7XQ21_9FLAO|nr:T9SS type A sorting domain-containing protein [Chryseobacterium tructae]MDN3695077.1 T9SS type A sorting domain-containing protein [Chryseobacterium tructae]
MKKILLLTAVLCCALFFSQALANWQLTTPFFHRERVMRMEMLPDGSYLVQKRKSDDDLMITENNGKTWRRINDFGKVRDFKIHNNKGYLVIGFDLVISDPKFSTPGISYPLPSSYFPQALFVLNDNTIFISTSNSRIMKSTDGGVTWNVYSVPTVYADKVTDVFFTDANTGFCVTEATLGKSFIFKSTDGGQTWVKVSENANKFEKVIFKNSLNGIATLMGGTTKYTLDGGNTWNDVNITWLRDIKVYNNEFVAVGSPNILHRTSTGEVWDSKVIYPSSYHLFTSLALNSGKFIAGVDNETGDSFHHSIFKSTDLVNWTPTGVNWKYADTSYNSVYATKYLATMAGYISKDKGVTWEDADNNLPRGTLNILPNGKGIGLGKTSNKFWTTNDHGLTWTDHNVPFMATESPAMKPDGTYAIAMRGSNAEAHKGFVSTYNPNTGWSTPFDVGRYVRVMKFVDNNVGFLLTQEKMMKTVDGGLTWSIVNLPGLFDFARDIIFGNSSRIYVGQYCSTDLGNTWFSSQTVGLKDFDIFADGTGYGVDSGNVFKTTDYGVSWQRILNSNLYSAEGGNIFKHAFSKDYIIGTAITGFYVLDLKNGTLTTSDSKAKSDNKLKIYPNPTSSVLFFDSKEQIKNVVVVDIVGRVLKNIESPKETSVDISDLAKGNYFVKITTTNNKTYFEKVIKK